MISYLKEFVKWYEKRAIQFNLLFLSVLLSIFSIWLTNAGVLPFFSLGDFVFFSFFVFLFALYRPGWAFLLLIGLLPLEIVSLSPAAVGISVRPYQLLGALVLFALLVRKAMGRGAVELPRLGKADLLVALFVAGGFVGSFAAPAIWPSFKQALVAASFAALYFLARIFVSSRQDLVKVAPFFFGGAAVAALYAVWQNWRFKWDLNAFEVMAGRPNAAFAEPDWLGVFLVFALAMLFAADFFLSRSKGKRQSLRFVLAVLLVVALVLTVARSAWLGAAVVALGYLKIVLWGERFRGGSWDVRGFFKKTGLLAAALLAAILLVKLFNLSSFELASRAASTAGLQKITVACKGYADAKLPERIEDVERLSQYGCQHINLEEIADFESRGFVISEIYRPDPNVGIRAKIYAAAWQQIKAHVVFGMGWGSIGAVLGSDERGAALNASNIFLETWLGAGLSGVLALTSLFALLIFYAVKAYFCGRDAEAAFLLLGVFALIVPNLFNSGIFLGFVWLYLGAAAGMGQMKG